MRIDSGPGYRLYVVRRERQLIVPLCGGAKSSQRDDIKHARALVLDSALVVIERAKVLSPALDPASTARLSRAADAIGRKMIASPRAADDRRAA